jgi:hypothetical protein
MDIRQVTEKPENLEKPDDNNNHHHNVDDSFDFNIHWDVGIDKP